MTAPSPIARPAPGPVLAAAIAGIVALAFVGAPQSVSLMLLVGFDNPRIAGTQLVIGLAGAVGTGLAVLLARQWTLVLVVGGLLMTVAYLVHPVAQQGLHAEVVDPDRPAETPSIVADAGWVALLVGGAAIVLVGVLGAAGHLMRSGSRRAGIAVAGMAAAAGYAGSMLFGWLPAGTPRVVVLVIAVLVMVAGMAGGRTTVGPLLPRRMITLAWVAALLPVVPTLTVAITGQTTYQSVAGMVVCLLVLAGAVGTCWMAGMPVLRAGLGGGLVLAAPVPLLVLVVAGSDETVVWVSAVVAFVVMAAVVAVLPRPGILVGVLLEAVVIAVTASDGVNGAVAEWAVYALAAVAVTAAVAAGAGVADATLLPVLLPMVTAVAVGMRVVLDSIQLDPGFSGLNSLFGSGSLWFSVVMLVVGALVLAVRPGVPARI